MKWGVVCTDDSGLHNEIFNNTLFRDGGIREFIGCHITIKDAQTPLAITIVAFTDDPELRNEIFTIHNKGRMNLCVRCVNCHTTF